MFSVKNEQSAAFEKVVLTDTIKKTQVTVLPACGAILHSINLHHNGNIINLLESYDSTEDFKVNAENKGFRNVKMSPFACRIKDAQYSYKGSAYTIEKFLLNGSAIHGLVYNEPFTVTRTWADVNSAGVTLVYKYKATDKGYPFHFHCEVSYELKPGNTLLLKTRIINTDTNTIPVQDGWHPYFTFNTSINDIELQFKSEALVEFDASLVPTGKLIPFKTFNDFKQLGDTFFDNCFTLLQNYSGPACTLRNNALGLQVEIWPDASYPYLQIYTPPHRNSIAVENLSAAPDAFNNGMGVILLQPETSVQFTTEYKISSLN
mgnify:CR=1 FL=1